MFNFGNLIGREWLKQCVCVCVCVCACRRSEPELPEVCACVSACVCVCVCVCIIGASGTEKQKILRRGSKNTQKNYTKKILMTQITMMV